MEVRMVPKLQKKPQINLLSLSPLWMPAFPNAPPWHVAHVFYPAYPPSCCLMAYLYGPTLAIHPSSSALPLPRLFLRTVFHFSPSASISIFAFFHFLPPHVVLLFIPLYSFPPSPPFLSSLSHIWFLSMGLCVFGVTQSSLGLPTHISVFCRQR